MDSEDVIWYGMCTVLLSECIVIALSIFSRNECIAIVEMTGIYNFIMSLSGTAMCFVVVFSLCLSSLQYVLECLSVYVLISLSVYAVITRSMCRQTVHYKLYRSVSSLNYNILRRRRRSH